MRQMVSQISDEAAAFLADREETLRALGDGRPLPVVRKKSILMSSHWLRISTGR